MARRSLRYLHHVERDTEMKNVLYSIYMVHELCVHSSLDKIALLTLEMIIWQVQVQG
jgi:hypothetical protein